MIDANALTDAELDKLVLERDNQIELSETGLTQRDALLSVTDEARLWRTPEGETYATVDRNDHREHHPIASRGFRDWLLAEFGRRYRIKGRPASVGETAIREAKNSLEARAYDEGGRQEAPLRTVRSGDAVYIDTGRPDWSAFEVSAKGWQTVASPPAPIVRSRGTGAFPEAAEDGDLSGLRQLLGHLSGQDFILLVGWCLAALYPSETYPILIFSGESGSGKTSLAQMAQKISDPVTGDVRQPPANDRDLIAAARQGHVLAFDNISRVKEDLADSICRLATGAEIGGRALFTDHDSASFRACRPIILNGIPDLAARADLADRSVIIKPPPIGGVRMTKADFTRRVAEIMPGVLTGLLDALVVGLRNLDQVPVPDVRMSDFARLVIAAEPTLPWRDGEFLEAYQDNRRRTTRLFVEGDSVAMQLAKFAERQGDWSGMVSELYATLTDALHDGRPPSDWPGSSQWFGNRLTRAIPPLRAIGIEVSKKEDAAGTRVSIRKIAPLSPLSPRPEKIAPQQKPQDSAVCGANGANGAKNPTLTLGAQQVCDHCGQPDRPDDPFNA